MFETLPSEVIRKIVQHLDRQDFIPCVQVCRSWRLLAPPYAADAWKHLHIKHDGQLATLADIRCFQSQIESCRISMYTNHRFMYGVLERLQGFQLQSLVLENPVIDDNKLLADLLSGITCESLELLNVTGACLDFHGVLAAASASGRLQHFSCRYDPDNTISTFQPLGQGYPIHPPPPPPPPPLPSPTASAFGLVSLELLTQNLTYDWMDLLRCCSSTLQHLHVDVHKNCATFSCQEIWCVCPQLQSLHIGEYGISVYTGWPPALPPLPPNTPTHKRGLRYFGHWGPCTDHDAMQFVVQHQATLEYLYLGTWMPIAAPRWNDLVEWQSATLKTLVCSEIHGSSDTTIASVIRHSPSLESVSLYPAFPITDPIWHALASLDSLQSLAVHLQVPYDRTNDHVHYFQSITHHLSSLSTLRELELVGLNGVPREERTVLSRMLHDLPLVKLRLVSISALNDDALAALVPNIQRAETVHIVNCTMVSKDGIKALVDGLPKLRHLKFMLAEAQRMPAGITEFIEYAAQEKGVELDVRRLD